MTEFNVHQSLQIALQHHQAQRLQQAEVIYHQILARDPSHYDALHLLGVVALQAGRNDAAVELIRRAIAVEPHLLEAYGNLGVALQALGRLDEAVAVYRQAITLRPNSPEAHKRLGVALSDKGRWVEAIEAYRQAIALRPDYAEAFGNLGIALKELNRVEEAIAAYRQAIALQPDYAEAHNNVGIALKDHRQLDDAIAAFRQAAALRAGYVDPLNNLGIALSEKAQFDEAVAAYRKAIAMRPGDAKTYINLGVSLRAKGQFDEAIAVYRRAVALRPDYAEAYYNLGIALKDNGQAGDAIAAYQTAIALCPGNAQFHNALGIALNTTGRREEAVAALRQATVVQPGFAEAYYNLGIAHMDNGCPELAVSAYRQAIALRGDYPEAFNNLGLALQESGQLDEALDAFRRAISLHPDLAEAHSNLGVTLTCIGRADQAIAAYRQAMALRPDDAALHSNLLYTLHFQADHSAGDVAQAHRRWDVQHAMPLRKFIRPQANDRSPDRRLRIGYVSPDFRQHPVASIVLPLLACHDREAFDVFCYAQVPKPDTITVRCRANAGQWRSTVGLSDEQIGVLIREDRIDILVDLAGHTAGNRLLVFARKPAPIQISSVGYPNTTGLNVMDYRLTDAWADPPGIGDALYCEQLIRLPRSNWVYQPFELSPAPDHTRAGSAITFGCFNNFAKVTEGMLVLWARILRSVPGSRLLLKSLGLGSESARRVVQERFIKEQIEPGRLELRGIERGYGGHLALYNRMDIALDPFPYHGTTSTCEAMWMGVPVVTLAGLTHVSRVGVSLLMNMGLAELVAQTPNEYHDIAVNWAQDLPRCRRFHSTLRERMERSPLMDAPGYTRAVEDVYRRVWRKWCAQTTAAI